MRRSFVPCAICCLMLAALGSGCNLLSAIAYKTVGPGKIPAEYVPPQEPMLVLTESYHQANDLQPFADQLGLLLQKELETHKVAPLVDPAKLAALKAEKGRDFEKMRIPEIARALGARQVMYVDLQECSFDAVDGAQVFQGAIKAKVRVVDVATAETRWPGVGDGHLFATKTEYVRRDARDTPLLVRNMMLEDLAGAISRLFYDFKPDHEGGRGEPD
jgi:hypothetical protein